MFTTSRSLRFNNSVRKQCPQDFPYAFKWGEYCCRTTKEGTSTIELEGCDGGELSLNSICCDQNDHVECPHEEGCNDSKERGKLIVYS